MKKLLLISIALILSASIFSQNLDFENWTQNNVLYLDDYETMTHNNAMYGQQAVIRSTDFTDGQYSIRLETILSNEGDIIFGYFTNGDPETLEGGQAVSLTAVDSVIGYYKYDIQPNDTALFLCFAKFNEAPVGGDIFTIIGTQSTWARFSYPILASSLDTVIIAAASSNAINELGMAEGSWIMFDDIQLKSNANGLEPIQNYSFENWTDYLWEDLEEWTTPNQYVAGATTMPVEKTTDAYSGTYASQITTTLHVSNDTVGGNMSYGEWTQEGPIGGFPYSEMTELVRFRYKTSFVGIDTAYVSIVFKKLGSVIAWHGTSFTQNESAYTLWEQPISLPETPDTVFIAVSSGDNPGSQIIIDNFEFLIDVGFSDINQVQQIIAFPNPASDKLNFRVESEENNIDIRIYSLDGKLKLTRELQKSSGTQEIGVNISELSQGNYIYKVRIGNETFSKSFVKE